MPFTSTAPLRRAIQQFFPDRPFTIELWDGSLVPATSDHGPTLRVRSPGGGAHLLRAPDQLGLGCACALVGMADAWQPPPLSLRSRARLMRTAARADGVSRAPTPEAEVRLRGALHSKSRDARWALSLVDSNQDLLIQGRCRWGAVPARLPGNGHLRSGSPLPRPETPASAWRNCSITGRCRL